MNENAQGKDESTEPIQHTQPQTVGKSSSQRKWMANISRKKILFDLLSSHRSFDNRSSATENRKLSSKFIQFEGSACAPWLLLGAYGKSNGECLLY